MLHDFHFLRPWWLLLLIPIIFLSYHLSKQKPALQAWRHICDPQLLTYLLKTNAKPQQPWALYLLISSCLLMVIALAGPTWLRRPVPIYQAIKPHVMILDLSEDMLQHDLLPTRLARAKFKIHDVLQQTGIGQFGLIVYTSEPFVVSPLTNDGQTIAALLPALAPNLMPVQGNRLDLALKEVSPLLSSAGANHGEVLVLTGKIPTHDSIEAAIQLADKGIYVSVIPMLVDPMANALFKPLARAGHGHVISFSHTNQDIKRWLSNTHTSATYQTNTQEEIPLWYDEGRWFLLAALILLMPIFRRGWLQRLIG